MTRQKWIILLTALLLMAGTASVLAHLQAHRKLGAPGVKTHALANSKRLQVDLPAQVLDYTSEDVPIDDVTLGTLPQDTSFGTRRYQAPDNLNILLNVVLMGTDRTSLHKPQFCLEGQGYHIDPGLSQATTVRIEQPWPYDLPVVKLVSTREEMISGQIRALKGIYVYWYVAEDGLSAGEAGFERMYLMAKKMLTTGVLQRWAYVSCFSVCAPGQEEATFERQKQFIAAAVPQFQLFAPPTQKADIARQ